ncbi:MAG: hypothetical protein OXF27_13520 [Acidobacteria bacterium]|nr:hypothetical protein [Acidobacteriota bacterium]
MGTGDGTNQGRSRGIRGKLAGPRTEARGDQDVELLARLSVSLPPDQNPAAAYLASRADPSRKALRRALIKSARLLAGEQATIETVPWADLRAEHLAALSVRLRRDSSAATTNQALSAVRGVVDTARRMGQVDLDECERVAAVPNVPLTPAPPESARIIPDDDIRALFKKCLADKSPAGKRDAAMLALLAGAGLRRLEACRLQLADYDRDRGEIRVAVRGGLPRAVFAHGIGKTALDGWIAARGPSPGPLLCPVNRAGQVEIRQMSGAALLSRLYLRVDDAEIDQCTADDLRNTYLARQRVEHMVDYSRPR